MGRSTTKKSSGKNGANKAGASKAGGNRTATATAVVEPGPELAIQRGITAAEQGDKDTAHKIFSETVELYPSAPQAWVWLGGTSPDLDDAEMAFERAYTLDPDNEYASLGLRWVRLQRKAALNVPGFAASPDATGPAVAAPESPALSASVSYAPPAEAASFQTTTVACPNCGKENSRREKFCQDCGQDLQAALAASNPQGFIQPAKEKRDISRYVIAAGVILLVVAILFGAYLYFANR
jgi:tetratricopeptide (TPR) repeat protein